jgi:hypothetical protein
MTCVHCDKPHVCVEKDRGPLCNHHLHNPPPSRIDLLEREVTRLRGAIEGGGIEDDINNEPGTEGEKNGQ